LLLSDNQLLEPASLPADIKVRQCACGQTWSVKVSAFRRQAEA